MDVFDVKFYKNYFGIIKKFLFCLINLEKINLQTKFIFIRVFFLIKFIAIDSKYERIQDGFSLYSRQHMPIGAE